MTNRPPNLCNSGFGHSAGCLGIEKLDAPIQFYSKMVYPHTMKSIVLFVLALSAVAYGDQRAQGFCTVGGSVVVTSGVSSTTKVMASYPSCTVNVYLTGTLTHATLFSDNSSTPLANPFTATSQGYWRWYAANGRYDVTISGGGLASPFTYADILLADPTGGGTTVSSVTAGAGITAAPNTGAVVVTNTWGAAPSGSQLQYARIKPNTGNNTTFELANLPVLQVGDYNFAAQSPSGTLSSGVAATVTILCPLGLAYNDVAHYIRIAGTGTPETVLITSVGPGTCTSGAASGTITFTPANSHSAGWTLGPASFGLQECANVAAAAGGGTCVIPDGSYVLLGKVTIASSNISIQGGGLSGTVITRTGNFGDSIYIHDANNVHISGLSLSQTITYAVGPPPTIVNRPTSGAHIHFYNCALSSITDSQLDFMPYGIDADGVGWWHAERNTITSLWDYAYSNTQVGIAGIYMHHSTTPTAGYPTYAYVRDNVIIGQVSASRTITVNGNSITRAESVGPKHGIWVAACEVCWVQNNDIESTDSTGVHLAYVPLTASNDAGIEVHVDHNSIDNVRLYGIDFDTSAQDPSDAYWLNTFITNNKIQGSLGSINGIYMPPASTPGTFLRTASGTLIANNEIFWQLGSSILMLSGAGTTITGNNINTYNGLNSYPLNDLTCGVNTCTGDRMGNSAIYTGESAAGYYATGNKLGGDFLGNVYDDVNVFTVNAISGGYNSTFAVPHGITAPNQNGGVQPPASRSTVVAYDPAFLSIGPATDVNLNAVSVSGCGSLSTASTVLSGIITSGTTGSCTPVITFSLARAANGWNCSISNRTTANLIRQTASATSGATFTGTTVSGDVLSYACTAY